MPGSRTQTETDTELAPTALSWAELTDWGGGLFMWWPWHLQEKLLHVGATDDTGITTVWVPWLTPGMRRGGQVSCLRHQGKAPAAGEPDTLQSQAGPAGVPSRLTALSVLRPGHLEDVENRPALAWLTRTSWRTE